MQKTKKGLLMSILWALVLITTVVSSVVVAQSAKAAKLYLRHNITYTAPTCIQVTFDANGGTFDPDNTIDGVYETTSVREDTYNTTIKISTLSDGSIFPADEPTKSGYTFGGWEYSVNGTSYSDYASASDMPFTDHLYVRAKWEEILGYTVTINISSDFGYQTYNHLYYETASFGTTAPTNISSNPIADIESGTWTQCTSLQVVIQNVKRIFITFGGEEYVDVDRISGLNISSTSDGIRTGSPYYFDSGDLTGNVSYSITLEAMALG